MVELYMSGILCYLIRKSSRMPLSLPCCILAVKNGNKLNVVDFGGSLGSTWFQVRDFISSEIEVSWSIAEQVVYVEYC